MNTFCELTGLEPEGPADRHSLVPLLTGNETEQPEHPYLYLKFIGQIALSEGDFKYYQDQDGDESLYNLANDIHEDRDIKEQHPVVFAQFKTYINREHRDYVTTPIIRRSSSWKTEEIDS